MKNFLINRLIVPLYIFFAVKPLHRKAKKATKSYWEDLDKAIKSGDLREGFLAGIHLNQAIDDFWNSRNIKKNKNELPKL